MKLLSTEITPFIRSAFFIEYRERDFFSSPFHIQPSYHSHPELELVYIIEGYGKRIIGNEVESFTSGDMVFIGSNVPHIWLSDQTFYKENSILHSRSIVAYLSPDIFSGSFDNIIELSDIKALVEKTSCGIQIIGKTRDLIGKKLLSCVQKSGFYRFEEMLQILHILSSAEDVIRITDETAGAATQPPSGDRLIEVINYIKNNFSEQITLKKIARMACMTEQSFCRYFRSRTQKSFSAFLLEQRMSHGASLLLETDKPVTEIAFLCGYSSVSRFCQVFKKQYGVSPLQKRAAFRENLSLPVYNN
ncbi:AraC family transcriptional regulator [Agriterribacter sp.]|uniref:AraC family transcriptional regulator n=1 Tax=Agriterribacter sp. TaxID=2821509 RepID=UPI002BCC2440|nr:AraC family transcriptional regulator [Agriterribacter sp.]HRP57047.1 AraC family transcriptional regulator [Agriterribacter sp.]